MTIFDGTSHVVQLNAAVQVLQATLIRGPEGVAAWVSELGR
jgi:hypothetical protein